MAEDSADITELLEGWRNGNAAAENQLFEAVYGDLTRLAHLRLRGERRDCLQTTELVNQIYIRLVSAKNPSLAEPATFFRYSR